MSEKLWIMGSTCLCYQFSMVKSDLKMSLLKESVFQNDDGSEFVNFLCMFGYNFLPRVGTDLYNFFF